MDLSSDQVLAFWALGGVMVTVLPFGVMSVLYSIKGGKL